MVEEQEKDIDLRQIIIELRWSAGGENQQDLETAQCKASLPLSSFDLSRVGFSLKRFSSAAMSPSNAQSWIVRFLSPPPRPIILFFGLKPWWRFAKYKSRTFF